MNDYIEFAIEQEEERISYQEYLDNLNEGYVNFKETVSPEARAD